MFLKKYLNSWIFNKWTLVWTSLTGCYCKSKNSYYLIITYLLFLIPHKRKWHTEYSIRNNLTLKLSLTGDGTTPIKFMLVYTEHFSHTTIQCMKTCKWTINRQSHFILALYFFSHGKQITMRLLAKYPLNNKLIL